MFDIGGGELMLILVAVLVFFGPKKLPELAQSLGRGIREFKRAQREFTDHINQAIDQEQQRSTRTVARPMPRPVVTETPAIAAPVVAEGIDQPAIDSIDTIQATVDATGYEVRPDARPAANGHRAEPRDQG